METEYFSEFSYGYAVTSEIIQTEGALNAPQFLSLFDEAQTGGGYDVQIATGTPLFLQFKLSDYMAHWRSLDHDLFNQNPYYRFFIRPSSKSEQHRLLIELEQSGERVFYIAPEFHTTNELDYFYRNNEIVRNSAAFSPLVIGEFTDHKSHRVVFERGTSFGYCFSEPKEIRKLRVHKGLRSFLKEEGIPPISVTRQYIENLAENMLRFIETDAQRHVFKEPIGLAFGLEKGTPSDRHLAKTKKEHQVRTISKSLVLEKLRTLPPVRIVDHVTKIFMGAEFIFLPENK